MSEMHQIDQAATQPIGGERRLRSRRDLLKMSLLGGGALIVGPGLLAACGSGGTPKGGSGGGGGGSITVGVVGDILTFDPYQDESQNFIILQNLNTQMIDYNDQLAASPAALTKWEMSSDKTQMTLTLRDGVNLQTGKVWTADDLVESLHRAADPNQGQQLNGPMDIVKGYHATDPHTVVLTFTQPVAEGTATDLLEMFPAMDAADNNDKFLATKPASGGPFRLVSRNPGNTVTVARYADYWNASNVFLDNVTFQIFGDNNSMVAALQSGSIDLIYNFPPVNAAQLKSNFTILQGFPGALVDCLRFNLFEPPWDKIEMRQAVARAVDRDRIVKEVYFGYSQPLYLPWGPNSPANDPSYKTKNSYDLTAAKSLWRQAGSPASGQALMDGSDSTHVQMMQIIQQSLSQIGFNLKLQTVDTTTLTNRYYALQFGMMFNGLGNTSKNDPTRITTNSIFRTTDNVILKNKLPQKYVDGIKAAQAALTPEAQKKAYAILNQVISTDAFAIPICTIPTLIGYKKSLTGVGRTVDNWLILEGAKMS